MPFLPYFNLLPIIFHSLQITVEEELFLQKRGLTHTHPEAKPLPLLWQQDLPPLTQKEDCPSSEHKKEWYVSMGALGRDAVMWQQYAQSDGRRNAGTKEEAAPECKEELSVRPVQEAVCSECVWYQGWGGGMQLKVALPSKCPLKSILGT